MKYKVGDKVRVRKDLEVGETYGDYRFNSDMAEARGKTVTIKKKYDDSYILEEIVYCWTDEMLEPVEDIIEYKDKKYDVVYANVETFDLTLHLEEHKEEILDKAEKRYLKNVIKYVIEPTHNEIKCICKIEDCINGKYFILFIFESKEMLNLPYLKGKSMYKGMELDKEYTLEQLGLDK